MSNYDYVFLVYAEFFVCITLFGLVINTVLLKFSKTLGIRDKENTMVRWNPISKPALGGDNVLYGISSKYWLLWNII